MNKQMSLSFIHDELKEVKTHKREFLEEMDAILAERRANWKPKAPKYTKGLLKLYSQHAVSPMKGAYMQ